MKAQAYVHVAGAAQPTDEWLLSVSYGSKLAQLRIVGTFSTGLARDERLATELVQLGAALTAIAANPRAVQWERSGYGPRQADGPKDSAPQAQRRKTAV